MLVSGRAYTANNEGPLVTAQLSKCQTFQPLVENVYWLFTKYRYHMYMYGHIEYWYIGYMLISYSIIPNHIIISYYFHNRMKSNQILLCHIYVYLCILGCFLTHSNAATPYSYSYSRSYSCSYLLLLLLLPPQLPPLPLSQIPMLLWARPYQALRVDGCQATLYPICIQYNLCASVCVCA